MLVGQVFEGSAGKVAVQQSRFVDGTAFMPFDDKYILDFGMDNPELDPKLNITDNLTNIIRTNNRKYKVSFNKVPLKEIFRDGSTGHIIRSPIFLAVQQYQRLNKLSAEQIYSSSVCRRSETTGQPIGGKRSHGGQRLGEMEKDVLVACGVIQMLNDKFFIDSDGRTLYFCQRCGTEIPYNSQLNNPAAVDVKLIMKSCSFCRSHLISAVRSSGINNYANGLIQASGITFKRHMAPTVILRQQAPSQK